jgi:hypothetical protein
MPDSCNARFPSDLIAATEEYTMPLVDQLCAQCQANTGVTAGHQYISS